MTDNNAHPAGNRAGEAIAAVHRALGTCVEYVDVLTAEHLWATVTPDPY